jgi:NAD+ kinase
MSIKKIGIIANIAKESSFDDVLRFAKWLLKQGIESYFEEEIARKISGNMGIDINNLASQADLLVVFGGDGTILRTARAVKEFHVPIVGINLGGFGYLTEINLNEMYTAFDFILSGDYQTETRMMLDVELNHDNGTSIEGTVLNDVVINRGNLSRIVQLETMVDDRYLTTFKADGLIVSTPTGSTAYSLSAGGPIVFPQQDSIIMNPICPHTLTNRPLILPEGSKIKIVLWTKEHGATITLDGQVSFTLVSGEAMTIKKSKHATTLVSSPHRDYLEILRTKLGWGMLPAAAKKG